MSTQEALAEEQQTVVFRMGEESYGIDIFRVHEIIRMREITPIPRTNTYVRGIINLGGKTIPVVDLSVRLQLDSPEETDDTRIIVVENESGNIGIIVDEVTEVITLQADQIEDTPALVTDVSTDFVKAVARCDDHLITLLDLDNTLTA